MSEANHRNRYHHGDLRTALLQAAESSLRERGAAQISLRDLAREVGVSHAAPRRHFPERQDLLDALAETGFLRLGTAIRSAMTDGEPALSSRMRQATTAFARFASDNPALLELMNATKHRPESTEITRAAESAFSPLVDLIHEGQDAGELRAGPVEEVGLILYATVNGLVTLVNSELVPRERLEPLVEAAITQFFDGVATRTD